MIGWRDFMKCKSLNVVIIGISCITLLTGCTLFPLRDEGTDPVEVEEEPDSEVIKGSQGVIKPSEVETDKNVMICVSPVNVRDAASSNSNIIGELEKGDEVTVLSKDGGWYEIEYKGKSAYVYERYLSEKQDSSSSTSIYKGQGNSNAGYDDEYNGNGTEESNDAGERNSITEDNKIKMYLDE